MPRGTQVSAHAQDEETNPTADTDGATFAEVEVGDHPDRYSVCVDPGDGTLIEVPRGSTLCWQQSTQSAEHAVRKLIRQKVDNSS